MGVKNRFIMLVAVFSHLCPRISRSIIHKEIPHLLSWSLEAEDFLVVLEFSRRRESYQPITVADHVSITTPSADMADATDHVSIRERGTPYIPPP
jgi:hypothetical protein